MKLKRTTLVAKLRRRKLATADGRLPSVIEDEADAVSPLGIRGFLMHARQAIKRQERVGNQNGFSRENFGRR